MSYRTAILTVMYLSPHTTSPQARGHCTHILALVYQGTAARCMRAGYLRIQAEPKTGCAFWEREVGADDEAWPPVSADIFGQLTTVNQPSVVAWAP